MRRWISFVASLSSTAFWVGLEMSDISNVTIGYSLMALSVVGWVVTIILFFRQWQRQAQRDSGPAIIPSQWQGLSDAEVEQARSAAQQVLWSHECNDLPGIVDDIKNGRPLNGPCWVCGEPRFLNREAEDNGEVQRSTKGP